MKIEITENCGNAPKLLMLIDLVIALADRDVAAAKQCIADNFIWREIGKGEVARDKNLETVLVGRPPVSRIIVTNVLSHGKGAMCEGGFDFDDGDKLNFCAVGEFEGFARSARIKEVRFYFA